MRIAAVLRLRDPDEIQHLQQRWAALLSPKPFPHPFAVWNVYNLDVAHDPAVNWIGPFEIWNTSYLRTIDDSQSKHIGPFDKLRVRGFFSTTARPAAVRQSLCAALRRGVP